VWTREGKIEVWLNEGLKDGWRLGSIALVVIAIFIIDFFFIGLMDEMQGYYNTVFNEIS